MASPAVQKRPRDRFEGGIAKRRRPLIAAGSHHSPFQEQFSFPLPDSGAPTVQAALSSLWPQAAPPGALKRPQCPELEGQGQAGKIRRMPGSSEEADLDAPRYSQRHMDFMERQKRADVQQLRAQCEETVQRERQRAELAEGAANEARSVANEAQSQMSRMQEESRVLKRAVTVQDQRLRERCNELSAARARVAELEEALQREKQTSYALRVHLAHTSQPTGPMTLPDVY